MNRASPRDGRACGRACAWERTWHARVVPMDQILCTGLHQDSQRGIEGAYSWQNEGQRGRVSGEEIRSRLGYPRLRTPRDGMVGRVGNMVFPPNDFLRRSLFQTGGLKVVSRPVLPRFLGRKSRSGKYEQPGEAIVREVFLARKDKIVVMGSRNASVKRCICLWCFASRAAVSRPLRRSLMSLVRMEAGSPGSALNLTHTHTLTLTLTRSLTHSYIYTHTLSLCLSVCVCVCPTSPNRPWFADVRGNCIINLSVG